MKKICIVLLLASACQASGPKYNFLDPKLNDELVNVYKDISTLLKAQPVLISSMTVSSLTVTTSFTFLQAPLQFTTETSSTTTSATFTTTNACQAITLSNAANRVRIDAYGVASNSSVAASNTFWSLFRGSTDLGGAADVGFGRMTGSTGMSGTFRVPVTITYIDTPASVGPHTYCVKIRNDAAATAGWGAVGKQTIIVEEIK